MQRRLGVAVFAGLMLSLAAVPAAADCTTSGNTVTCTSSGGPQTTPVGTGAEDGITVNVQQGATVDASGSPGAIAIYLNDGSTVNNAGSVIASTFGAGVSVNNGSTVNNTGSILVGDFATTINACCSNIITNSGTLTAGSNAYGLYAADGNTFTNSASGKINVGNDSAGVLVVDGNTIVNRGTITAGTDGAGISANDGNTITNAGSITVGDNTGVGSFGIATMYDSTVINTGTITVGFGGTGIAIDANTFLPPVGTYSVTNTGDIVTGIFGTGINITDKHRVLNSGTITTGDFGYGLTGIDNNVVTNTGTINVGLIGTGVDFQGVGNVLNNFGTIRAAYGFSIASCSACSANNTFNNMAGGTLDGMMNVVGVGDTVVNNGLITITSAANPIIGFPTFLIANLTMAGAGNTFVQSASGTLALRMDNAGAADILSADAIIARGTLKIAIQNQLYNNTTYSGTVVHLMPYGVSLGNTISTPFDRYIASSPFFAVTPIYDSGDSSNYTAFGIQLDRLPFGAVPGMTKNQSAVGNALEPGYSSTLDPTSTVGQFYVNMLSATSLGVLDQLSGAGTAAAQDGAFAAGSQFGNAMFQQGMSWLNGTSSGTGVGFSEPLGYASAPRKKLANRPGYDAFAAMTPQQSAPAWRAWTSGFGSRRSIDGQPGTADQSSSTFGGGFGVDRQLTPDLLLGVAAGGSGSNFSVSGMSTSGRINGGHIGAYAAQRLGTAYLAASVNYARSETTTDRTITGVGPTENAKGRFDSDQLSGRIELGRKFGFNGYAVTPFVALEPSALWQNAYTESSTTLGGTPGILGLRYNANKVTSLPLFLGAQIDASYALAGGQTLSPYARLSWVHEFKPERSIQASFINIPGPTFTVDGARAASDAVRLDMGGSLALSKRAALNLNVTGEFSDRSNSVAALGGLRMNW